MVNKGQVSLEYMVFVAGILMLIVPVMVVISSSNRERADDLTTEATLDQIKVVSERVFLKGYPETETIIISMPQAVSVADTYVDNNTVQVGYVTRQGTVTSSARFFVFSVNGTLPPESGIYVLQVSARPDEGIAFSYFKFQVTPERIQVNVSQGANTNISFNMVNINPNPLYNISLAITGAEDVLTFNGSARNTSVAQLSAGEVKMFTLAVNGNVSNGYYFAQVSIHEEERFFVVPVIIYVEYVDLVAPIITRIEPQGLQHETTLNLSVRTNEVALCRYATNNQAYESMPLEFSVTNVTQHEQELSGLSDGAHVYYVRCADASGNTNTQSALASFELNTSIPQITLDSPLNQTYFTSEINLNATVSKQAQWCTYVLDSGSNVTLSNDSQANFFGVANTTNGTHSIRVYCRDLFGNVNATNRFFTTDLSDYTSPTIIEYNATPFPLEGGAENFALLSVTASDNAGLANASFAIKHPSGLWENSTSAMIGLLDSENYDTIIAQADEYEYNISVSDLAGNVASVSGIFYVITDWWNFSWNYRIKLNVSMGDYARNNELVHAVIDLSQYLPSYETLDPNSIRVVENITELPYDYEMSRDELTWFLNGTNPAGTNRTFYVYFDTLNDSKPSPNYQQRARIVEQSTGLAAQYWFNDDWNKVATIDLTKNIVQSDWFDSQGGLTEFRTPAEEHVFQPNNNYFQIWSYYKISQPYIYYKPKTLQNKTVDNTKVYQTAVTLTYDGNTTDVGNFTFTWVFFFDYNKAISYLYQNWTVFSAIYSDHGSCNCDWPKQGAFSMINHVDTVCYVPLSGLRAKTGSISPSERVTEPWVSYNFSDQTAGAILHAIDANDLTQGYEVGAYQSHNVQLFNSAWRTSMPVGNHYSVFKLQAISELTCETAQEEYLKELFSPQITITEVSSR